MTGLVDGRDGTRAFLRRWVLWRVGVRWYVVALVGPPALGLLVGLWFQDWSERFTGSGASVIVDYLASLCFLVVLGGGQEEPGWRGFALPRMQERMSPLAASVVLGVLWGLWHLPVFVFVPGYNSAGTGVASIAVSVLVFTAVGTVGQSLILAWLFNHTRGSVLLAVLAHASLDAGSGFVAGRTAIDGRPCVVRCRRAGVWRWRHGGRCPIGRWTLRRPQVLTPRHRDPVPRKATGPRSRRRARTGPARDRPHGHSLPRHMRPRIELVEDYGLPALRANQPAPYRRELGAFGAGMRSAQKDAASMPGFCQ